MALRVVYERQSAEVGDAVVATHPDARRVGDGRCGVGRRVPAVVEACGYREAVVGHHTAPLGLHPAGAAAQGEVGVAKVAAFATVARGEAHEDGLPVVGAQVYAYRRPVFPQHFVRGLVPPQVGVGYEVGHRAGVCELSFLVQYLEPETRLQGGRVLGVLQHGGITQHQQVGYVGVDGHAVGDALGLGRGIAATVPVTQPYRGGLALRYGAQQATGARVALGGVEVHRMTARGTVVSVVYHADMLRGVVIAAIAAGDVCRMQVGVVYASRAALRREGVEGVGGCRQAVAHFCTAVGDVEYVVGQRR